MKTKILTIFFIFFIHLANSAEWKDGKIYNHLPSIFVGSKFIKQSNSYTPVVGINYQYQIVKNVDYTGIGFITEAKYLEKTEFIFGPAFYFYPTEKLNLFMAPSVFYSNKGLPDQTQDYSVIELNENYGNVVKFVMRFGASYQFEYRFLNLSPVLGIDLIGKNYEAFLGLNICLPLNIDL